MFIIKRFSESSLPIAISAFAITLFYSELLTQNLDFLRATINFCSTFFIYNFVILLPKFIDNPNDIIQNRFKLTLSILSLISILPLLYCIQYISFLDILNYSHLFVLSLFYELPIKIKLRRLPYMKSFLISYVWTMSVVFPYYYDNIITPPSIFLIEFFLFIFLLCLLFDFRDKEVDLKDNIRTLANSLTSFQFKFLIWFIFILSTFFTMFIFCKNLFYLFNLGAIAFTLLTISEKRRNIYYLIIVDGLITLRALSLFNPA